VRLLLGIFVLSAGLLANGSENHAIRTEVLLLDDGGCGERLNSA
jgi:hypothetical protein